MAQDNDDGCLAAARIPPILTDPKVVVRTIPQVWAYASSQNEDTPGDLNPEVTKVGGCTTQNAISIQLMEMFIAISYEVISSMMGHEAKKLCPQLHATNFKMDSEALTK